MKPLIALLFAAASFSVMPTQAQTFGEPVAIEQARHVSTTCKYVERRLKCVSIYARPVYVLADDVNFKPFDATGNMRNTGSGGE